MPHDQPGARPMCALTAQAAGEDPIGSAVGAEHYLAFEVALPWPAQIEACARRFPGLQAALGQAATSGIKPRLLALAPDAELSQPGATRLIHFRRPAGMWSVYEKHEFLLPPALVAGCVKALLGQPEALDDFALYRQETAQIRDLFVCTHGSFDACCGAFGYPLYQALREEYVPLSCGQLRAWRVSHFGGHRFAPTLIDFPEGRYWAYLDRTILDALVYRRGPASALRPYYRGWSGLRSYFEQVAEGEILAREGWKWARALKCGSVLQTGADAYPIFDDQPPERVRVEIDYRMPGEQALQRYSATVVAAGQMSIAPRCGLEQHLVRQYRVAELNSGLVLQQHEAAA